MKSPLKKSAYGPRSHMEFFIMRFLKIIVFEIKFEEVNLIILVPPQEEENFIFSNKQLIKEKTQSSAFRKIPRGVFLFINKNSY